MMQHPNRRVVIDLVTETLDPPVIVHVLAPEERLVLRADPLYDLALVRNVDPGQGPHIPGRGIARKGDPVRNPADE